jgi:hypothetical protein
MSILSLVKKIKSGGSRRTKEGIFFFFLVGSLAEIIGKKKRGKK